MGRIISQQVNIWGSAGGVDAQRTDLWVVDMQDVVKGLNAAIARNPSFGIDLVPDIPYYFAQTVSLPELKVNAGEFGRDSNPYQMPVHDEATGMYRIVFLVDSPTDRKNSKIYRLLDTWRMFVRAGRTPFGKENSIPLYTTTSGETYSTDHAFNVTIHFLRGSVRPDLVTQPGGASLAFGSGALNDLEKCGSYQAQSTWLSSFKFSELTYSTGNTAVTLEANLYCAYFLDLDAAISTNAAVYH